MAVKLIIIFKKYWICRSTSEPLWVSMSNLKSCFKRFWIYHSLYAFTLPVKIKSHGAKNHKKSWPPDSLKYENEKNENRCKQLFDDDHFGIWRWMSHIGFCSTSNAGKAALYTYKMIKEIGKITKKWIC